MHGTLNFNENNENIFNLNLQSLITQLKNIEKVNYTKPDKTDKDYLDVVVSIYSKALEHSANEEIEALLPIFVKRLKELTQTPEKLEKFKNLGATNLDIAFINNDVSYIREISQNNEETNVYALEKKYRFMEFAIETYEDNFDDSIDLKIEHETIKLSALYDHTFTYNGGGNEKNLALFVNGDGQGTWDYNYNAYEYKYLHPLFNKFIIIREPGIIKEHAENIKKQNLDFVFLGVDFHDSKEQVKLQELISELPGNLAKETVYLFRSCYSGQYHENWKKEENTILITDASKEEKSDLRDFNAEKLNEFFTNKEINTEGLIEFFSNPERSTPHISGIYKGKNIEYMPVKDFHQQLHFPAQDSPILGGTDDIEITHL